MMHQLHMVMAMREKLCTKHNYQFMHNLDSEIITEAFRHCVNFLAKWPLATRMLLQQNCSVNLSGKKGHGIELDGFVESEVVQPLKKYANEHTTIWVKRGLMCITLHNILNKHPFLISLRGRGSVSRKDFSQRVTARKWNVSQLIRREVQKERSPRT